VLQEALTNEDDARHRPTFDQLGPEAVALLKELQELTEPAAVCMHWHTENVVGVGTCVG
jgi:hypothetical protein